jgi:hypothetical protein
LAKKLPEIQIFGEKFWEGCQWMRYILYSLDGFLPSVGMTSAFHRGKEIGDDNYLVEQPKGKGFNPKKQINAGLFTVVLKHRQGWWLVQGIVCDGGFGTGFTNSPNTVEKVG